MRPAFGVGSLDVGGDCAPAFPAEGGLIKEERPMTLVMGDKFPPVGDFAVREVSLRKRGGCARSGGD